MVSDAFVLDASVTAAWCFADEASEHTAALLASMGRNTAVVPGLWHFETASLLLRAERRGRISRVVCTVFIETLMQLPIETDTESESRAHGPVLALARTHELTPYDAAYLDLAIRRALPLATRDQDLVRAARECGVDLVPT
jgi:predicted nucleic acid-binding protein